MGERAGERAGESAGWRRLACGDEASEGREEDSVGQVREGKRGGAGA